MGERHLFNVKRMRHSSSLAKMRIRTVESPGVYCAVSGCVCLCVCIRQCSAFARRVHRCGAVVVSFLSRSYNITQFWETFVCCILADPTKSTPVCVIYSCEITKRMHMCYFMCSSIYLSNKVRFFRMAVVLSLFLGLARHCKHPMVRLMCATNWKQNVLCSYCVSYANEVV